MNDMKIPDALVVSGAQVGIKDAGLHGMFEASERHNPDKTALVEGDRRLTYRDLARLVDTIALNLARLIPDEATPVLCCLERSVEQVALYLALLKTGRVCVPVGTEHPEDRLLRICSTAACKTVIHDEYFDPKKLRGSCGALSIRQLTLPGRRRTVATPTRTRDDAFIFFTSGSTGEPKGVWFGQKATLNSLAWRKHLYHVSSDDVFLYKNIAIADTTLWEIFLPLINGARAVIARPRGHIDFDYLADIIAREGVTIVQFVGTMLRRLVGSGANFSRNRLRAILCGGERWDGALAREVMRSFPGVRLFNVYGQTESSLGVLAAEVSAGEIEDTLDLNQITFNTSMFLVDENGNPCTGAGELCVSGVQLSRGYCNNPDATSAVFKEAMIRGEQQSIYKTGDYFEMTSDRKWIFRGRKDNQVKLNGWRIELEEIENAANSVTGTSSAGVIIGESGEPRLRLYVVKPSVPLDISDFQTRLKRKLPDAVLPSEVCLVDNMPITAQGKLRREEIRRWAKGG